jgi:hypothetical protein
MCLTLVISARTFSFSRDWLAVGRLWGNSRELRKETRYALALSRWLELEAERSYSADALWTDFTFLVKKLGFSKVRLIQRDGEKSWEAPFQAPTSAPPHCVRQEINHALFQALEFSAPSPTMPRRVCELLSELAAEAWVKACVRWQATQESAVNFAGRKPSGAETPTAEQVPLPIFVQGDVRP